MAFEPELLDLCNILSVQRASKRLRQKYERIDAIILNAGIGGWVSIDFWKATKQFFKEGIAFVTRPEFKIGSVGAVAPSQIPQEKANRKSEDVKQANDAANGIADARAEPELGEVFSANTFGHYLLVHYIMPLLSRPAGEELARVISVSTMEAYSWTFSMDDFQGMKTGTSYESSKRLSDILALTASAPLSKPYTDSYFASASNAPRSRAITTAIEDETLTPRKASLRASTRARSSTPNGRASSRTSSPRRAPTSSSSALQPPTMYCSHPGIVVTDIVDLPFWWLIYGYIAIVYIARWCGSPWHNAVPYSGATAMTHLALAPKKQLDAFAGGDGTTIKWGSATNWRGNERVKPLEVHWLYDDNGNAASEEERQSFFGVGREAWKKMEELRVEWEQRLKDAGYDEGLD